MAGDFAKSKHRVGKAKPGAVNATSTSFKAKKLLLREQNVERAVDTKLLIAQASHHKAAARKEALSRLERGVIGPTLMRSLLECAARSMVDEEASVRQAGFALNRKLFEQTADQLEPCLDLWLGYWKLAMTHLSSGIRRDALKTLHAVLRSPLRWPVRSLLEALVASGGPRGPLHREACLLALAQLAKRETSHSVLERDWHPERQSAFTIWRRGQRKISPVDSLDEALYSSLVACLFEDLGEVWLEAVEAICNGHEPDPMVTGLIQTLRRHDPANLFFTSIPRAQLALLGPHAAQLLESIK